MKYIKTFEKHSENNSILIIVDVQKSFSEYFTNKYVKELKKYCQKFNKVYQIFDNHVDGKNVDKDYLYDEDPDVIDNDDLYNFPNQVDLIEKRYNYDVDADFYKKILDVDVYEEIKKKEDSDELKRGDYFKTKVGTIIVYIANNHQWFHLPNKLYDLFTGIVEAQNDGASEITLVGGSSGECIFDIEVAAKSLGVKLTSNKNYIYSASECPIK